MRVVIPLLLSAMFVTGIVCVQGAYAQPSTSATAGTMPLSPDNCGTPDEPKPCPGAKRMTRRYRPKAVPAHETGATTPK